MPSFRRPLLASCLVVCAMLAAALAAPIASAQAVGSNQPSTQAPLERRAAYGPFWGEPDAVGMPRGALHFGVSVLGGVSAIDLGGVVEGTLFLDVRLDGSWHLRAGLAGGYERHEVGTEHAWAGARATARADLIPALTLAIGGELGWDAGSGLPSPGAQATWGHGVRGAAVGELAIRPERSRRFELGLVVTGGRATTSSAERMDLRAMLQLAVVLL